MMAQGDHSSNYTGNITLNTTGGTSATSCKISINDTQYNGIKAGTGSVAGAVRIVVPADTKYLHLHVAAWKGENVSLAVTGYSQTISNISLTSNDGITGNSPFTFSGDPSTNDYYKVITFANALNDETYLIFTATSGKRFVVWGVTAESDTPQTTCTVSFDAGSGSCATSEITGVMNTSITLPSANPSQACADNDWTFAGWATSSVDETTTAPDLLTGNYTITGDVILYAVYRLVEGEGGETVFNFESIASANSWENGTQYLEVEIEPITLTATGGSNTGKYFSSDHTWRIYSSDNGSVTVASANNNIVSVSSNPSRDFSISNGQATFTASSQTNFKSITVSWGDFTYMYATSPSCEEKVATPTFSEEGGVFYQTKTIELSCATEGATILYKLSQDGNWETYSSAITINETTTIWAKAILDGMPDSNVASQTYTRIYSITVNQTTGGTVSVSLSQAVAGTTITLTVTPNVGYSFDLWSIEPSTVAITNNQFTMPASDVTVSASFIVSTSGTRTVSFSVNNIVEMTATVDAGNSVDMTKFVADVITEGYIFKGWYTQDGTKISDSYQPTSDIMVYAQFDEPAADAYELVTNADQLEAGKLVVIAASDYDYAVSYTQNTNNRGQASITKNNNNTISLTDDVCEFVLGGTADAWTFYDNNKAGYLHCGTGSSNQLLTNNNDNDYGKWTISVTNAGVATIKANAGERNWLRYNSSNNPPIFACYASGQKGVCLYTKSASKRARETVVATAKITGIPANVLVTVNGIVTYTGNNNANNANNFVVEDGAQLITNSAVNATLQKEIVGFGSDNSVKTGWYTIASPLTTTVAPASNMLANTYDLYYYDEADFMWYNYKPNNAHSGFSIEPYKGYLYANSENTTLSFSGVMRASNVNVSNSLSYASSTENAKGFNLVGNPFTYNLTNSSNITIGGSNFSTYYVADGTVNNEGKNLIAYNIADRPIKPGEGFFVQATAADQSLVFNGRGRGEQNGYIRILAGNESFTDRAYVQFGGGNTLRKMTLSDNTAKVYVMQDNKDYAAAIIEKAQGEMPVNFKASANGTYTVTVNPEGVELNYLHLIDNMTGMDVDLLQTPSYTFDATTNDYASRFRLVFSANGMNENGETETFAFYSNGNWVVGNEGEATLQVIDVNGRIVSNETINGTVATSINATPGVYMLRLVNGNEVKTQKIVVR